MRRIERYLWGLILALFMANFSYHLEASIRSQREESDFGKCTPVNAEAISRPGEVRLSGTYALDDRTPKSEQRAMFSKNKEAGNDPPLFKFVQLTDCELSGKEDFCLKGFRPAIERVNDLNPDFVIITGDLTATVNGHEGYVDDGYRQYNRLISGFKMPVFSAPGNHDAGYASTRGYPACSTVSDKLLAMYRKWIGKNYYSFNYKSCHFIILDSEVLEDVGAEADEQWKWLEDDLKNVQEAKQIFAFCHIPPFLKSPEEPATLESIHPKPRKRLLDLLEHYSVSDIFSGHLHATHKVQYKGMDIYVTGATNYNKTANNSGVEISAVPVGFALITVYPDKVTYEYQNTYRTEK